MKCSPLRLAVLALGLVLLSALARPILADPVVYFGWDNNNGNIVPHPNSDAAFNQFLATLSSYGVEPVDAIDTSTPLIPGVNVAFNPTLVFRTTPTGTGSPTGITATTDGVFATDGTPSQNLAIGTKSISETDTIFPPPTVNTSFHLSEPVTAFGLYVMQAGDAANNPITFQLSNTVTGTSTDVVVNVGPSWGDHNIFFVGFGYAVPFNQVTLLEAVDGGDGMVYDNIVAGTFVPEPGSFALLSLGLACVCGARRTRRSRRS